MRRFLVLVLIAFGFFHAHSFADQIVMSNGDRLSGLIMKLDSKELVIKTEFAGEVTVQWTAITEINSTDALHVVARDGQTLVGPLKTSQGNVEVESREKGPVVMSKDAISSLRNQSEEAAYEKSLHPGLLQGWNGGGNVSFALTRGNSQTKNLALAFMADRKTSTDHLGMYANSVFSSNDAPGAIPSTTAQATQGGVRYDHDLDARLFGFVGADFQTDALQDLNLRSVFSAGLGLHVIKSDRTTLDLLGGGNYTRENYSTLQRNVVALTIGEELMHKLGAATVLTQKLYAYPDLNDAGEYRTTFNFGTVTKLNKWLGWQNAFGDIYVTNPPAGKKQNDILLATGLNVSSNTRCRCTKYNRIIGETDARRVVVQFARERAKRAINVSQRTRHFTRLTQIHRRAKYACSG
jgi:putative salt-induced outer membrane protein YdiY